MAFPAGLQTVMVTTGPHLAADGSPLVGAGITLTPEWALIHEASGTQIHATPVVMTTDAVGMASAVVVASDATGLRRTNFTWTVSYQFGYGGPSLDAFRAFLPAATPTVDLELIAAVGPSGPSPVVLPAVTSVAGYTGAVTGTQIAGLPEVRAAFLPVWVAAETVAAGVYRLAPDGTIIKRNSPGTTRSLYDSTEQAQWTVTANLGGGGAGYTDEQVRDVIGTALRTGAGLNLVVDDAGDTITLSVADGSITPAHLSFDVATQAELNDAIAALPAAYTDEQVRDVMGAALRSGIGIQVAPDDNGDTITISASGSSIGAITPQVSLAFASQSPAPIATYAQLGVSSGAGLYAPFVTNIDGKIDNPVAGAKYYMLCSTNHSQGAGGLYLLTAPSPSGPWSPYAGANGALVFQDLTANTFSTETPWVVWEPVSRLFYVYYQQAGIGGNQGTCLAVTPDFITWERIGAVFVGQSPLFPGDQHTGYAQVARLARNLWVAWHLNGGSDFSRGSISYSYDGVKWFDDTLSTGPHADMTGQVTRTVHTKMNLIQVNGQLWGIGTDKTYSSGVATGVVNVTAAPIAPCMTRWARPPQLVWEPGYAWETALDGNLSVMVDNDGTVFLYYVCGDKANGGIGLAKGSLTPMREAF